MLDAGARRGDKSGGMLDAGARRGDKSGGMLDLRDESPLSPLRGVDVKLSARDLAPLTRIVDLGDDWSPASMGTCSRPFVAPEGVASLAAFGSPCVVFSLVPSRPRAFSGFVSRGRACLDASSVLILFCGGNGSSRSGCRFRFSDAEAVLGSGFGWERFLLQEGHKLVCDSFKRFGASFETPDALKGLIHLSLFCSAWEAPVLAFGCGSVFSFRRCSATGLAFSCSFSLTALVSGTAPCFASALAEDSLFVASVGEFDFFRF